jgi:hypothetical protein
VPFGQPAAQHEWVIVVVAPVGGGDGEVTRYNTRRRHSANGHLSPNEYEHRHHTAKLTLAA